MATNQTQVLKIFDYLTGRFLYNSGAEHTKGFRMVFGAVTALKGGCTNLLPRVYTQVTDQFLIHCAPHSIARKIFGGLLLPFVLFMFLFHTHMTKGLLPYLTSGAESWSILYYGFFIMAVINFVILMLMKAQNLNNPSDRADLEERIKNDEILSKKSARCPRCEMPNVLRSYHCLSCDEHIAKFHRHSRTLNKCIGAGNLLPYVTFQFFLLVLFLLGSVFLRLGKTEEYKPKRSQKLLYNISYLIYACFAFGRLIELLKNLACLYFNFTYYESTMWTQLGYLWKNPRKDFFNPFDKGPAKNLKEELNTIMNIEDTKKRYSGVRTTEDSELHVNPEDPEDRERRAILEETNRIVNWRTEKITNVIEVYASPMRKIFLDFLNKSKGKKQRNMDSDSDEDDDEE